MVERFLRYSLETGKRIRVMLVREDGSVGTQNLFVTRLEAEEGAFYARVGRGAEKRYALDGVLSAGYARGDEEGK